MKKRVRDEYDEPDHCSYISRMHQSDVETLVEGCGIYVATIIVLIIVFLVSGCSTGYVAMLRHEYDENGVAEGAYFGEDEYPRVFPATRIAATIEVPAWWCPRDVYYLGKYTLLTWPIGAVLSIADVPISVVSDVVMLPYDAVKTFSKGKEEEK